MNSIREGGETDSNEWLWTGWGRDLTENISITCVLSSQETTAKSEKSLFEVRNISRVMIALEANLINIDY